MPINFAMAFDPLIQAPHMQATVAGTLANVEKVCPHLDFSGGWLPVAVKGGIDPKPGTPSVPDNNIVFALNQYYDEQAPGADLCYSDGGCKVIEADARRLHELWAPPRPVHMPANMAAKVVLPPNDAANYARTPSNVPGQPPVYADAPGNGPANPGNIPARRATI